MGEWPFEQGVVFSWEDLDIDGNVRAFAWSVTVEEHGGLQFVSVLTGVEWRRDQLETVLAFGFDHFSGPVGNFPQERSSVVGTEFGHSIFEHVDLLPLPT